MSVSDRHILLAGVIDYMDKQLLPTLTGEHRFMTRVAVNALKMIGRELRSADLPNAALALAQAELAARLYDSALTQRSGDGDGDGDAGNSAHHQSSRDDFDSHLADAIRHSALSTDDTQLLAYLRLSMQQTLAINNPKWLAASTSTETP